MKCLEIRPLNVDLSDIQTQNNLTYLPKQKEKQNTKQKQKKKTSQKLSLVYLPNPHCWIKKQNLAATPTNIRDQTHQKQMQKKPYVHTY